MHGGSVFSWHLSLPRPDENNAFLLSTVYLTGMIKVLDLVWKKYSNHGISVSITLGGFVDIESFSCVVLWIPLDFINFKFRPCSWQHHARNSKIICVLDSFLTRRYILFVPNEKSTLDHVSLSELIKQKQSESWIICKLLELYLK